MFCNSAQFDEQAIEFEQLSMKFSKMFFLFDVCCGQVARSGRLEYFSTGVGHIFRLVYKPGVYHKQHNSRLI